MGLVISIENIGIWKSEDVYDTRSSLFILSTHPTP
jgi:hypothetical protein